MILRFLLGLVEGAAQPCITTLIAQWSPEKELSARLIFTMSGMQIAVFALSPFVACYCKLKTIWGGWPIGYWSSGILALIWCFMWRIFVTNYPEKHKMI